MKTLRAILLVLFMLPAAALAADFEVLGPAGLDQVLASHKGKVILVNYWASWCPPCRMEVPELSAMYGKLKKQGLMVLGVSFDLEQRPLTRFVEKARPAYPIYQGDRDLMTREGITALPTTLVIDRRGERVGFIEGYQPPQVVEAAIAPLLLQRADGE